MDDLPAVVDLARRRYPAFDPQIALMWGRSVIARDDCMIAVTDGAFGVASVNCHFYEPGVPRGYMLFLCAEKGLPYRATAVLRFLLSWALMDRGAVSFHFGEATGVNLAPLAKRVGAVLDRPSYVVTNGKARP